LRSTTLLQATEQASREPSTAYPAAGQGAVRLEGDFYRNPLRHVGRNDPCRCGSSKKFKKCGLGKAEPVARAEAA
jgi:uncharacterized protein YchJ